jgi:putative ABC transport system permease protein
VIGRDLAKKFNFHLADRIHLIGDIYPGDFEFTIRGIFDSPRASEIMYISRDYLEQSIPERRRGQAGTFIIVVDKPESASRVAQAIDNEFRNSTVQTKTESEQAYLLGFVSLLGNVRMFLIGISAAVMFTILLVCANTMAMSVRERVREVGILKTLGFTPGTILGLILSEACAISLAGGLIGFIVSGFLTRGVRNSPAGAFLPPVNSFEPAVAAACIFTALGIGVISSMVPAFSASRTPIVQALRTTD